MAGQGLLPSFPLDLSTKSPRPSSLESGCQGTTRFDTRWHFASLVSSSSTISQRPTPSAATPGQSGASRRVLLGPDGRLGTPVGSEADEQSVNFAPDS
ncbi:unnamed protein product [Lampetra planeri]